MFFDPTYILFILMPSLLIMGFAQWRVKSAFDKYAKYSNARGLTGAQVADLVMRSAGIYDVHIEPTPGSLTDHFDPQAKVLRLSEPVYNSRTIAAIGVAAHEAGHAVQQHAGYAPMLLRTGLVPVANIGVRVGPWIIIAGVITQLAPVAWIGLLLFACSTIFALVTLPLEYNASARARQLLESNGLILQSEYGSVHNMLNAAALTYVASFLVSLLNLIYYAMLVSGVTRRSND